MTSNEDTTKATTETAAAPVREATDKIAAALAKAQGAFKPLKKSRTAKVPMKTGGFYTYDYADLADVVESIREALSANGMCFTQTEAAQGIKSGIATYLYHESGQVLRSWTALVSGTQGTGPQAHGSALTYTRRYGLCLATGVVAEEDDDAQVAEGSGGGKAAAKPKPPLEIAKGTAGPEKPAAPAAEEGARKARVTEKQLNRLYAIARGARWTRDDLMKFMEKTVGHSEPAELSWAQYDKVCNHLLTNPMADRAESAQF